MDSSMVITEDIEDIVHKNKSVFVNSCILHLAKANFRKNLFMKKNLMILKCFKYYYLKVNIVGLTAWILNKQLLINKMAK